MKPRELKQVLVAEGFQVFRVVGSRVVLAARERENLIMDSGVAVVCGEPHAVRLVLKAQARDYPAESEAQLFARARALAPDCLSHGYQEVESAVVPVPDPVDAERTLDVSYQVVCEKRDIASASLADELRFALAYAKTA